MRAKLKAIFSLDNLDKLYVLLPASYILGEAVAIPVVILTSPYMPDNINNLLGLILGNVCVLAAMATLMWIMTARKARQQSHEDALFLQNMTRQLREIRERHQEIRERSEET